MWLKQSTAATVRVGPFVDPSDGVTPVTGITLGAADQAEILKNTGATVDIAAATFAAVTGCDGWYDLSLTTSHTDTLGMITVIVQDASACLPVFVRAQVLPANVYDSLVGNTDVLDVSLIQWLGTAPLALDTQKVQTHVASLANDSITNAAMATAAITDDTFATTAANEIRDAVLAAVVESEGSYTLQQVLSICLAVLAGTTTNSGNTLQTPNGAANRVVATTNASNERTSMTLSPSS